MFFFFFFLGPVCVGSGSTSAFKAYCAALNTTLCYTSAEVMWSQLSHSSLFNYWRRTGFVVCQHCQDIVVLQNNQDSYHHETHRHHDLDMHD
jgi:hypothetical protein